MDKLYAAVESGIEKVLRNRYKLTMLQAKEAVSHSPLKKLFMQDAEMAAHTSNETWAREIYKLWKKQTN